ncbi:MAG: ABC transporter permease [Patescibacteria group bacterium]
MNTFFSDWYYLSIRNIKLIWRPLLALLPPFFMPIFFFAVNSLSLSSLAKVPGFPDVSYKDFIAPVAMFTAIFFSAGNAGIELVQDIQSGYFKKLIIMPINRLAIVLAKLTEIAVQSLGQGLVMLVLLLFWSVEFKTGVLGVLTIFGILVLFAMAWSCLGMIFALRTQNARLVQSMFILVFPLLYLTTSQSPRDLLPATFARVTDFNPVTYIIEGIRSLVITGWGGPDIGYAFLAAGSMFVVFVTLTLLSFRKALK